MASRNIGGGRALKVCDECGGVDDHPRHVFAGGVRGSHPAPSQEIVQRVIDDAPPAEAARLIRELLDTGSTERHMDCCRKAGCPTGDCDKMPDKTGKALLDHIVKAGAS